METLREGLGPWQQATRMHAKFFPEIRRVTQLIVAANASPTGVIWLENAVDVVDALNRLSLRGAKKSLRPAVERLRTNLSQEILLVAPDVAMRLREDSLTNIEAWLDANLPLWPVPAASDPNRIPNETAELRVLRRYCIKFELGNVRSDEDALAEPQRMENAMRKPLNQNGYWSPGQTCHDYTEVARGLFGGGAVKTASINTAETLVDQKAAYIEAIFTRNQQNDNNVPPGRIAHSFIRRDPDIIDVTYNQFFKSRVESWPPIFWGTLEQFKELK